MNNIISKNIYNLLFVYGFLMIFGRVHGQEAVNKIPFTQFLASLETVFQVKFSYADNDVKSLRITPKNFTSLTEALKYASHLTQLHFQTIDDRYIAISPIRQNICGTLIDNDSGEPLVGATVFVPGTNVAAITNSQGKFLLSEIPLNTTITISYIGYQTIHATVESFLDENCPIFPLSSVIFQLNEVVVGNYITQGISKYIDGSFKLSAQKLGAIPGQIDPDILQTLQSQPGIESVNETISEINIRGGSHDQNLILWDGIKMYHTGHFFGLISAFNPYLTEEVTVIKNGTPAKYGDAVSGTIAMQTPNTINPKIYGGTGFNMLNADAFIQVPVSKKVAIQASGRRSLTDMIESPIFKAYFDRTFQDSNIESSLNNSSESDFYFYDFTGKVLYDFSDKHQLRSNFISVHNELDYNETTNDGTEESTLIQQNFATGGQLISKWNNAFSTDISGYYTRYLLDATTFNPGNTQELKQRNEVTENAFKVDASYRFSSQLKLWGGYHFTETGIRNSVFVSAPYFKRSVKEVIRTHSLYSEGSYQSNSTFIRLGVRINHYDKLNDTKIEPRLSINQYLNDAISVKVMGEVKSQATTQIIDLQEDFLGVEKRRWMLANNKDIPVMTSRQVSGGFDYNKQRWLISTEGFYKTVDGITTNTQGFQNQNQGRSTSGSYTVKGIEFLINHRTEKFNSWISYTYSLNDYYFKELTPSIFPNNTDIRHSVSIASSYDINQFRIAIGLSHKTGKPYTIPVKGNEINNTTIPSSINYDLPNN